MSKRVIEIDLDGVFFDFHSEFELEIQKKHKDFCIDNVLTYDFNKSLSKVDRETLVSELGVDVADSVFNPDITLGAPRIELIKELSNVALFERAKPYKGAVESIKRLLATDCFKIVFNSYAGANSEESECISRVKFSRLKEIFNDLPMSLVISTGECKPVLSASDIVIEDNIWHLKKYKTAQGYLINQPFNQSRFLPSGESLGKVVRVDSLEDAVNNYILCDSSLKLGS